MKILPEIKLIFYLSILWAVFGLGYTLYVVKVDNGLFAQIAVPFLFLLIQLIFSGIMLNTTFKTYKNETKQQFKVVALIISILPIVLTFVLVPLLGP